MHTDISGLVGDWKHYEFSGDGKELMLVAEKFQVRFVGIVCLNMMPASEREQTDGEKEIYEAISYRLRDHRVPHASSIAFPQGTSVEIGPPHLRVYLCIDWDRLRKLRGFYIHADYFSATLICRDCELTAIDQFAI